MIAAPLALGALAQEADLSQYGPDPKLPAPYRGLLPTMKIANPAAWDDRRPQAAQGYTVTAIATGLKIPRQTLVLPNGDILVAEGRGGADPKLTPKDFIAGIIKAKGVTHVESGNRLTLLRDRDGDGSYKEQTVFADHLNAPYGLALVGDQLYVANQDALVRFDYRDGQTRASGPPVKVTDLPSGINHHWTKALAASADGRFLYVGIGSNSNITERGMAGRGRPRPDLAGRCRNRRPSALRHRHCAIRPRWRSSPAAGQLWAVVNERDEIGPNLVPDYLTSVKRRRLLRLALQLLGPERRHARACRRIRRRSPRRSARTTASDRTSPRSASPSRRRRWAASSPTACSSASTAAGIADPVGYKVVFVPFRNGRPSGPPVDFVDRLPAATTARPAAARSASPSIGRGALIVADDLSNTIWRVTAAKQ